MAQSPD